MVKFCFAVEDDTDWNNLVQSVCTYLLYYQPSFMHLQRESRKGVVCDKFWAAAVITHIFSM